MAVTQGTPVIGLYAHSNPGRTGPYFFRNNTVSVYHQVLAEYLQKQGKTSVKWGKRMKGEHLMSLISVDSVKARLQQIQS